ncbi:hypothetical protein J8340_22640 [Escherichia coli]|nr:hypothetical protein [Escherichia coli]
MWKTKTYTFVVLLILMVVLSQTVFAPKEYDINKFIKDFKIENPKVINLKGKSYIFSGTNNIYVFRGKSNFQHYVGEYIGNYIIGGMEKGSAAVILKNYDNNISSYSVSIDGVEETHEIVHRIENNFVIIDERIWNPSKKFEVVFFDNSGNEIERIRQ